MDDLDLGATIKGFSPGQKLFNRYTLRRILGRGGMGVVWLAFDEELERDVALKFLPEIVTLDPEAVADLKRETRRNLELTHPHIVRIYDFVADARSAAISMEYVDGSTLTALKLERPGRVFTIAELKPWLLQLVDALHYAHTKPKIVHRDLKPANLMITKGGELKVTDFGIARGISDSVSRVSAQAGSSGTPVYMSPQQMMGERPSVADDVYAFGATLFELLTSKPPFYSGNVILQVQSKTAPTVAERRADLGVTGEEIPAAWERTIAACLAKEAQDRPASIRAVAAALGLIEGGVVEPATSARVETPRATPQTPAVPAANARVETPRARVETPRATPQTSRATSTVETPRATSGKPLAAIIAASVVGVLALGAVGWWFGIHQPAQRRLAAEQKQQADAAALAKQQKLDRATQAADARARSAIKIPENLRLLDAAADQYFLENGVARAPVAKLVGPGTYIERLVPVAGEDYLAIGTIEQGKPFYVTTDSGARYTIDEDLKITIDGPRDRADAASATLVAEEPRPQPGQAWTNSLGMKFVPLAATGHLIGVWETRVQDFEAYARASGLRWRRPEFAQGPTHPAVNVTWSTARAFCQWLTDRERAVGRLGPNQRYRLPTDAEWSLAVGLPEEPGTTPSAKDSQIADLYPWGRGWPPPVRVGNYHDESAARAAPAGEFFGSIIEGGYDDGFPYTAPVGSFGAFNGLHDLGGNAWEWCEDAYEPGENSHVLRGGGHAHAGYYLRTYLLSSYRDTRSDQSDDLSDAGFRVVLDTGGR